MIWRRIENNNCGYIFSLSDSLWVTEKNNPGILNDMRDGRMIVGGDYSGQHKEATHEAYSFVVTNSHSLHAWMPYQNEFKQRWLPDGRRLSFKKLNEAVRWRALPNFLEAAARLKGNLITVMIANDVGSFMLGSVQEKIEIFPDCFSPQMKAGTVEKMIRLASLLALVFSGLRSEGQASFFVSDHDEVLETKSRREQFSKLASYLTFGATGWRQPADCFFVTTELDEAPCWAEDVSAIADLAAGAYCKIGPYLPAFLGKQSWRTVFDPSVIQDRRAYVVGHWLATRKMALKHTLLRLEKDDAGNVRASAQAFVNVTL